MSTYPPNQTIPKKGSDGYLWNWLGSSLKKFAAALSPYLGGGDGGVKVYRALLTQVGGNPPTAIVMENTLGANITYTYAGLGSYLIQTDGIFPGNKTFGWIAYPGCNGNCGGVGLNLINGDASYIVIETYDSNYTSSDGILWNTPIEILIYP